MIVLVTGFAGSGTSRIAEHLHRCGLPMAEVLRPPVAGTTLYQPWTCAIYLQSFEQLINADPTLTETHVAKLQAVCNYKLIRYSNSLNHWGLKSPLLLSDMELWLNELQSMGGAKLVMTKRHFVDCQDSIKRHGDNPLLHSRRDRILRLNEKLRQSYDAWLPQADVVVEFDKPLDGLMEQLA